MIREWRLLRLPLQLLLLRLLLLLLLTPLLLTLLLLTLLLLTLLLLTLLLPWRSWRRSSQQCMNPGHLSPHDVGFEAASQLCGAARARTLFFMRPE
jgi:hypothetical protein